MTLPDISWVGREMVAGAIYAATLVLAALCLARGHRQGHINLWDLLTSTDRRGAPRTDGRKLFETGAFFVMTVTFYYLTVTNAMSEWYAFIYVSAWVAARVFRDKSQIVEAQNARAGSEKG